MTQTIALEDVLSWAVEEDAKFQVKITNMTDAEVLHYASADCDSPLVSRLLSIIYDKDAELGEAYSATNESYDAGVEEGYEKGWDRGFEEGRQYVERSWNED